MRVVVKKKKIKSLGKEISDEKLNEILSIKPRFEKIAIKTGKRFSDSVEVVQGLHLGDRIIVKGSLFAVTELNRKQ